MSEKSVEKLHNLSRFIMISDVLQYFVLQCNTNNIFFNFTINVLEKYIYHDN